VLDEHGFGHHGTGAAGTGEPGDCHQQMQKEDGQIAQRRILTRRGTSKELLANLEFTMHTRERRLSAPSLHIDFSRRKTSYCGRVPCLVPQPCWITVHHHDRVGEAGSARGASRSIPRRILAHPSNKIVSGEAGIPQGVHRSIPAEPRARVGRLPSAQVRLIGSIRA